MVTMDMIKHAGGSPALDVGGGASPDRVATAFRLLLLDRDIRAILVNIFAGINRCDWVAQGIVQACREISINVPLVVRLAGTNVEAGRRNFARNLTCDERCFYIFRVRRGGQYGLDDARFGRNLHRSRNQWLPASRRLRAARVLISHFEIDWSRERSHPASVRVSMA